MRTFIGAAAALAACLCLTPRAAAAPDADRLFARYCVRCHGQDFKGSEFRKVSPEIPDFTSADWHAKRSDARLRVSILDGRGDGMPSFSGKLSVEEVRSLVDRLRRAAPDYRPPADDKDDLDRRFEQLTREMDALTKEFYEACKPSDP